MADTKTVEIFDTTCRDGTQGEGVDLGPSDKLALTQRFDELGFHFIEGGWPGSNPADAEYFRKVQELKLATAQVVAFGSTCRRGVEPADDPGLQALLDADAPVICIFGKAWTLQVKEALRTDPAENLRMILDSIEYLKRMSRRPVFFDAEHYFDGVKEGDGYAIEAIRAAFESGADRIVLCDTNGGSQPDEIAAGVEAARRALPEAVFGIHCHDDGGLAVANTLAAVRAGCVQVQGTVNGLGERCGNTNLCSVIPNLELKLGYRCLPPGKLAKLTELSAEVYERANLAPDPSLPFVGRQAFAHKGGVHTSAVERDPRTYEAVDPASVGNERRILISELAGRSSIRSVLKGTYPQLLEGDLAERVLEEVQDRENEGYQYEAAAASFELLVQREMEAPMRHLEHRYRVFGVGSRGETEPTVATIHLDLDGKPHQGMGEGIGEVDALYQAIMNALPRTYPRLEELHLVDYKVRILDASDGSASRVRALTGFSLGGHTFTTVGVSVSVIEASMNALIEGIEYALLPRDR